MNRYMFSSSLFLALFLSHVHTVVAEDAPGLKRIPTPLPELVATMRDVPMTTIQEWMTDVELATIATNFDFSAQCDFAWSSQSAGREISYVESTHFRWAENKEQDCKRVIVLVQPLLGNEAIALEDGPIVDNSRQLDYFLQSGEVLLDTHQESNLGRLERLLTGKPSDYAAKLQYAHVFHPCRAAVVGFVQILYGGAQQIERHSILRETFQGSMTSGQYTHVLLRIGGTQPTHIMVTFADKCPVQREAWKEVDPATKKPLVYEVTRSEWKEHDQGTWLPVQIHAVRTHERRPGELKATVSWQLGKNVDPALFQKETIGWTSPMHFASRKEK
jgi:hypothetical protein